MFQGGRKREKSCEKGKQAEERAAQGSAKATASEQRRWEGKGPEESPLEVSFLGCLPEATIKWPGMPNMPLCSDNPP